MSLSEWRTYNPSIIAYSPDKLGIYELGDGERITLYYGCGKIRTRLLEHLNRNECPTARYFRFELLKIEEECEARVQQLLHEYQKRYGILPMYNERERRS
jgi:hypothetical protein